MLRDRKLTLILLTASLLAVSHLSTYFMPIGEAERDFSDIPRAFVEAIVLLNESNHILDRAGRGVPPEEGRIADIRDRGLHALERILEFEESLGEGDLAEKLKMASLSYRSAAEGAVLSANASTTVASAFMGVREALTLATRCRVEESLEVWEESRPLVLEAISKLRDLLKVLAGGSSEYVLSDPHAEIYDEGVALAADLLASLEEAYMAMEVVAEHSGEFEDLCRGEEPSTNLMRAASALKPGRAGRLSHLVASIKSRVLNCRLCQGGADGVGGGAGYTQPSSDD